MKQLILKSLFLTALSTAIAPAAHALSGDTKLACEAVLCLSSGTRPNECAPSLAKYFGITDPRPSKTIKKRLNFLQLCPTSNETPEMQALVSAISQGAGRCDADFLNRTNKKTVTYKVRERHREDANYKWYWVEKEKEVISSQAPNYCGIYANHEFTDLVTAKYVGDEMNGGRWVEASEYDRALQEYNDNLQPQNKNIRLW